VVPRGTGGDVECGKNAQITPSPRLFWLGLLLSCNSSSLMESEGVSDLASKAPEGVNGRGEGEGTANPRLRRCEEIAVTGCGGRAAILFTPSNAVGQAMALL
jgi:hypothetical protein